MGQPDKSGKDDAQKLSNIILHMYDLTVYKTTSNGDLLQIVQALDVQVGKYSDIAQAVTRNVGRSR